MAIVLLTLWGAWMIVLARWICGRWWNHLSLYTLLWSASLIAYELRLIAYYKLVLETWIYVFVAWISIYLGTALAVLISPPSLNRELPALDMKRLRNIIYVLSIAGLASTMALAGNIVRALRTQGIVEALTQYANQVYALRFEGEVSGIMYVVFLPYAGCVLAGIYTARVSRLTLAAILPLIALLADGIVSMQRTGMLIGALLFCFSYIFTPKASKLTIARWQKVLIGSIVLGALIMVTANRGGTEVYEGESDTLVRAGDLVPILPSIYLYASAPIPCLSEYLRHPENDGKALWGRYMFASIYRFLAKYFDLNTYVTYYPNFYYTPVPINAGTYLREIDRDFGGTAVLLYPFSLGFIIALLERRGPGLVPIVFLTFLYVVIAFSIDVNFVGGGGWYFPLPIALLMVAAVRMRPDHYSLSGTAALPNRTA